MCKVVSFSAALTLGQRLGLELMFLSRQYLAYPPRLSLSAAYDLRPTIKATLT